MVMEIKVVYRKNEWGTVTSTSVRSGNTPEIEPGSFFVAVGRGGLCRVCAHDHTPVRSFPVNEYGTARQLAKYLARYPFVLLILRNGIVQTATAEQAERQMLPALIDTLSLFDPYAAGDYVWDAAKYIGKDKDWDLYWRKHRIPYRAEVTDVESALCRYCPPGYALYTQVRGKILFYGFVPYPTHPSMELEWING